MTPGEDLCCHISLKEQAFHKIAQEQKTHSSQIWNDFLGVTRCQTRLETAAV